MNRIIIPMELRHLEAMADIERQCFSLPWSHAMLRDELINPAAYYLVAEQDGQVCGYAGLQRVLDEGYITNVATAPAFRRQGVADALLSALRGYAREEGLSFLTLEVRMGNLAAIALYEKHGFIRAGLRPGYYHRPREDALLMTKKILPAQKE